MMMMVVKIALGVFAGIALSWSVYQGGILGLEYVHYLREYAYFRDAQAECLKTVEKDEKGHFSVFSLNLCMEKLGWASDAKEYARDHKLVYKRMPGFIVPAGSGFEASVSYVPKEN